MLTAQRGGSSLIEREKRYCSVFRPPRLVKALPPQKRGLTADAQPWYPQSKEQVGGPEVRSAPTTTFPAPAPPPALDLSPRKDPDAVDRVESHPTTLTDAGVFSPLSTPITTFFHTFSDAATERRVYPLDMCMSVRRDASHTPHGVLIWCMRQYVEVTALKVPPHLQFSMNEVLQSGDGAVRGAVGRDFRSKMRSKPVRQTWHKVMSILSRITPQKYAELRDELMQLPLRQIDDTELQEVVKVFFEKAVQEPEYSELYARLVKNLCSASEAERDLEPRLRERLLSSRMRRYLITSCEEQFHRPIELGEDDMVDRTTGKPFAAEELELRRTRLKNRLVGNIKFIGELFKMELITNRVIESIFHLLIGEYDPRAPTRRDDYVFEVFATLLKTVAQRLKEQTPHTLPRYVTIAKCVEQSHPRPRIRFLMMDLCDLARKDGWGSEATAAAATAMASSVVPRHESQNVSPSSHCSLFVPHNGCPTNHCEEELNPADAVHAGSRSTPGITHLSTNSTTPSLSGRVTNAELTGSVDKGRAGSARESVADHQHERQQGSWWQQSHARRGDRQRPSGADTPQLLSPSPAGTRSPATSFLHFCETSDVRLGVDELRTPLAHPRSGTTERVNLGEVVHELMQRFNVTGEESVVVRYLDEMSLKNKVMCLTCWLRQAVTDTKLFKERQRITHLFSALLTTCPSLSSAELLSAVVEWLRFDVEQAEYERCPRMFDNVAHVVWYAYSDEASNLHNIDSVRTILHVGLFNVVLQTLITSRYTEQLFTFLKSAYPISTAIMRRLSDPPTLAMQLSMVVQNRFCLLPALLAVPCDSVEREATTSARLRCSGDGSCSCNYLERYKKYMYDAISMTSASRGHLPLSQCLRFQKLAEDTECLLFRKIYATSRADESWRQEGLRLALGGGSYGDVTRVNQTLQAMKVVGVMLACTRCTLQNSSVPLLTSEEVRAFVGELLMHRRDGLLEAALVFELLLHFLLVHETGIAAFKDEDRGAQICVAELRDAYRCWRSDGLVDENAVALLLRSLNEAVGAKDWFVTYFGAFAGGSTLWTSLPALMTDTCAA